LDLLLYPLAKARRMSFNFAYLSGGKLYLKLGRSSVLAVASEFGQAARERVLQMQKRNGWKQKNPIGNLLSGGGSGDRSQQDGQVLPVTVRGICPTSEDRILYTLEAGEIGGIFTLDLPVGGKPAPVENRSLLAGDRAKEKRLFHSADFKVEHVDFHEQHQLIACAVIRKDGTANIATMPVGAVHLGEVTEGDAIDLAPKWIPGSRKAIVFQSAGVSRDAAGYIIEHRHSTIEQLDFDTHEVNTLVSDPQYDLLAPQMTANGTLYYIRRPYLPLRQRVRFWETLKEVLLMPLRLLAAIFEWLNFFTRRYTGKALLMPHQPPQRGLGQMLFLGRLVDVGAEVERNRNFGDPDSPALIPRSWQLVEQLPHQEPATIACGVLAFDVGADGSIVYSNGSAVYGIHPGGVAERLVVDKAIEQVVILDGNSHDLN
jgi:hypothetical protein